VAGQVVVDLGALSRAQVRLTGLGGDLAGLDVRAPLAGVAGAVIGSAAAQQAARLADEAAAAARALSGAIDAMGTATGATAEGYLAADRSSQARLAGLGTR